MAGASSASSQEWRVLLPATNEGGGGDYAEQVLKLEEEATEPRTMDTAVTAAVDYTKDESKRRSEDDDNNGENRAKEIKKETDDHHKSSDKETRAKKDTKETDDTKETVVAQSSFSLEGGETNLMHPLADATDHYHPSSTKDDESDTKAEMRAEDTKETNHKTNEANGETMGQLSTATKEDVVVLKEAGMDVTMDQASTSLSKEEEQSHAATTTKPSSSSSLGRKIIVMAADPSTRQPPLHRHVLPNGFAMDLPRPPPPSPMKTTKLHNKTNAPPPPPRWTAASTEPAVVTVIRIPHAAARQSATQRFVQRVQERARNELVPRLVPAALLDECQHYWYLQQQQQQQLNPNSTTATTQNTTIPLEEGNLEALLALPVTVSPAQLLQRVLKVGRGRVARTLAEISNDDGSNDAATISGNDTNPYLEPNRDTVVQWWIQQASQTRGSSKIWTTADLPEEASIQDIAAPLDQLLLVHLWCTQHSPDWGPAAEAPPHPWGPTLAWARWFFPPRASADPAAQIRWTHDGGAPLRWELSPGRQREFARLVQQHQAQQDAAVHQQRLLEVWRAHSRQSGYWPLPSWLATRPAAVDDFVVAQRWAAAEVGDGRRKTSRDTAGIFYGNASLSLKQRMDALLRAVAGGSTLAELVRADDSSDPLRRTRTALGRLLFTRNQLSRRLVQTEVTDASLWVQLECPDMVVAGEEETRLLRSYVRELQQTELQLRRLVLTHLTDLPLAIVATAGDDRPGSMESMDEVDFENAIAWQTEGHPLLHQRIYRPLSVPKTDFDETTPCVWFEVTGFVPSVAAPPSDAVGEKPFIGRAQEPTVVERRARFRAEASSSRGEWLILTEAQVRAGRTAAEIHLRRPNEEDGGLLEHPFASGAGTEISLMPHAATVAPILGYLVGHDRVWEDQRIRHRILVLPKQGSTIAESFWTTLDLPTEGGEITCTVQGESYCVQQFDFHASSKAFQECMSIVQFLQRHPKAGVFQEPVNPIALGIPDYPKIVQHPMDVSTVLKKLERGDYSHIPPSFMKTASPVTRMLNGPFRNDVELIFDNAMLFNPPQDWIHQAASIVKKAVIKKIEQASTYESRQRKQSSIYVDYDSDVDMYVYESDYDDDYGYSRKRRKRPGTHAADRGNRSLRASEESATRGIERGIRVQKMLSDSLGLRGPLSNLPILSNASDFSLPSDWLCRFKPSSTETIPVRSINDSNGSDITLEELQKCQTDFDELLSLHRLSEEYELVGTRRSTRAADNSELDRMKNAAAVTSLEIEYVCTTLGCDSLPPPVNRLQVELLRERLHETYFAKLYQDGGKEMVWNNQDDAAPAIPQYANGSFPPYLGRVVPMIPICQKDGEVKGQKNYVPTQKWEIRESFVLPALRWIIRGLLYSEHLVQVADGSGSPLLEPLLSQSENALLLPNHVYFIDDSTAPFDVLDIKEMTRRKKQRNTATTEDSEDEIELSEYEKARAERVARNTQRLQALGLA